MFNELVEDDSLIVDIRSEAALGAGVLESLVAHDDKEVSGRLLKLIRVQDLMKPVLY